MSLKEDRQIHQTDINFATAAIATRGGMMSASTTVGEVAYAVQPSGALPIGILLVDVVDFTTSDDGTQTRHYNGNKDEMDLGEKVALANSCEVVTSNVTGTPSGGLPAYLAANGNIGIDGTIGAPKVGTWLSAKDSDGFAKLRVELG